MMAGSLDYEATLRRGLEAGDPYAEIAKIVADMRAENARLGGDDRTFGVLVCAQMGLLTLPCSKVESL